jgi:hypothetical protein
MTWLIVAYFAVSGLLYLSCAWLVPKRGPLLWEVLSLLVLPLAVGASLLYLIFLFLRSPSDYRSS